MIIKSCRKGHELTADMIQADGRCKVCQKAKRDRQKESGYTAAWHKQYRENMTEEQRQRKNELERKRREGRSRERDPQKEKASRLGLTKDEYRELIDDYREVRKKRAESNKVKKALLLVLSKAVKTRSKAMLCSAHVDHWKRVGNSLKIKSYYAWTFQRNKNNLLPCYVAKKLGGRVSDFPPQLIGLKSEIIKARRVIHELRQH